MGDTVLLSMISHTGIMSKIEFELNLQFTFYPVLYLEGAGGETTWAHVIPLTIPILK